MVTFPGSGPTGLRQRENQVRGLWSNAHIVGAASSNRTTWGIFLRITSMAHPTLASSRAPTIQGFHVRNRTLPRCAAGMDASCFQSSAFPARVSLAFADSHFDRRKEGHIPPLFYRRGGRCPRLVRYECRKPRLAFGAWEPVGPDASIHSILGKAAYERRQNRQADW